MMYCKKCNSPLKENARFCVICGTPVAAMPVQPNQPAQQEVPAQQNVPVQQQIPVIQAAPAPQPFLLQKTAPQKEKKRKRSNPLKVIIPIAVTAAAGAAAFIFISSSLKSVPGMSDFRKALDDEAFDAAWQLTKQLPEEDCRKAVERYVIDILSTGDSDDAAELLDELFDEGFYRYDDIYDSYTNGAYGSSPSQLLAPSPIPEIIYKETEEAVVSAPEEETEEVLPETEEAELPLNERIVGHWQKKLSSNTYEHIVFLDDGTGYIYSDIVSAKRSDTNSDYYYYDGKIHFSWYTLFDELCIDAEIDPYCFVAYQGYAAPNHNSNATWRGSKNGSHDYYFSFNTKDDYLCEMLSISSVSKLNRFDCLTNEYWQKNLVIADDAWDMYFYHSEDMDYSQYSIDYSTLEDYYYESRELRARYEDVDQYHFVPFTRMVLIGSGNETIISLDFDMEEYEFVE